MQIIKGNYIYLLPFLSINQNMLSQKIFDILLFIISLFGIYDFSQNQGLLMGYWSLMAVPLSLSVFFSKKVPILWRGLFVVGIIILLIKNTTILNSTIQISDLILFPTILIFLAFKIRYSC